MGRIRSIKPEWLDDEKLALASDAARVASVALLLLADDYGNGRANDVLLGSRIFPGDPGKVRGALANLSAAGFAVVYTVRGQRYFSITNWAKHQRVDKPGKPHVPGPDDPDAVPYSYDEDVITVVCAKSPGNIRESPGNIRRIPENPRADRDRDRDQDQDQDQDQEGSGEAVSRVANLAVAAASELSSVTGRKINARGKVLRKLCGTLAKAKHTQDEVRAVIRAKHAQWSRDPRMAAHLKLSVLLRLSNFEKYLEEDVSPDGQPVAVAPAKVYRRIPELTPIVPTVFPEDERGYK